MAYISGVGSENVAPRNYMIKRLLKLIHNHSSFLFGPRGVGKSTLVRHLFDESFTITFNLLKVEMQNRLEALFLGIGLKDCCKTQVPMDDKTIKGVGRSKFCARGAA